MPFANASFILFSVDIACETAHRGRQWPAASRQSEANFLQNRIKQSHFKGGGRMRKAIVGDALRVPQPYRAYIERLARATEDMREIAASFGLPLEDAAHAQARNQRTGELARALREQGCTFRNDGKSIVANALSPACERCRTGRKSVSLFLSLACPRSCWFCFNENQFDFKRYRN